MATVAASLKIFDAFSNPFQNFARGANSANSALQKLQAAANRTHNMKASLDVSGVISRNTAAQSKFNHQLQDGTNKAHNLAKSIKAVAAAYVGIEAAKKLWSATIGGAMEQQKMEDMFKARTGDAEVGKAMFEKFKGNAIKAGVDVKEALTGALSFFSTTKNSNQIQELNMIAKQLNAFDTAGNGLAGAVFSVKEALSGDIVSLSERFNIGKAKIRSTGLVEKAKKGDIDGFIQSFQKLLELESMGKDAFNRMLDGPAYKWKMLLNNLKNMFADAGRWAVQAFVPLINLFNQIIQSQGIQTFFVILGSLLYGIAVAIGWIGNNVIWLFDVISPYAPAILAFFAILALQYVPALIASLVSLGKAVMGVMLKFLFTNPILFGIALAIGLIIAVLILFGVTAQEIVGFVAGLFGSFFAFFHNGFALMWNRVVSFAEFLVNVFIDPVYAVKNYFYNMAVDFGKYMVNMIRSAEDFAGGFTKVIFEAINIALRAFNLFAQGLNMILGTEFKSVGLLDTENPHALSDRVQGVIDSIPKPTSDKDVVDFSKYKMEQWNLKDSFDTGYGKGFDFTKKLKDGFKMPGYDPDDILKKWDAKAGKMAPISGDDKKKKPKMPKAPKQPKVKMPKSLKKVDKVGKIEDQVDISSEDLKVMRELAEMKSIQNFVTLTPTVNVTTGDIREGYTVDEMIDRITDKLEKEFVSTAQGVYG
ncbi:hypothetical protein [Paenibacillus larvae]|uniref:Putative tail length tape measure protein n=1 Tax=Paenibacillus larvae subsp. larvae TaxID=147375 RepID=A0A2L1U434_9BACL|nr:hypothetical protein [Paenibacillus larvae]AQZ46033.1 hypothetical protein B5S25_04840 [Paenibacillus larvae subsp. pulvifaciens]AVF27676.1 putative tail length tape measure protein [Paenibacillus larvae subsp. larvae]MDR5608471.1 hypothetical protein [Paenibacillus larvae]